jgi:hypothetical protein
MRDRISRCEPEQMEYDALTVISVSLVSCADYLYPSASLYKLIPIRKNFAISFYLNERRLL